MQNTITFAPELWLLIASSLSPPELACLGFTSFRLLHIIRPILYRAVSLKTDASKTLALLARDKELARCVVELRLARRISLEVPPVCDNQSLVNFDALTNLISLKRITLCERVFTTAFEQREFGRALASIPLEELTHIAQFYDEQWPGDQLEGIRDLKKIDWRAKHESAFIIALLAWNVFFLHLTLTFVLFSSRHRWPDVEHTLPLTTNNPYPFLALQRV